MSKFTPAPWKIVDNSYILGPDGFDICEVFIRNTRDVSGTIEDEQEPNARLIAAAPLMYEALKDAINWYGLDGDGISDPTLSKLQAALDAAGGNDGNQ